MRTSGRESDLFVILVPLVVLAVTVLALGGGSTAVSMAVERHAWNAVSVAGTWLAALR